MAQKFDYHEYMGSRAWRLKRRENIEFWGNQCRRCASSPVENMHHLHYRTLGHEDAVGDLIGLCRACHEYLSAERDDDPAAIIIHGLLIDHGMTPYYDKGLRWYDVGTLTDGETFLTLTLAVSGSEADRMCASWQPRIIIADRIVGIAEWI